MTHDHRDQEEHVGMGINHLTVTPGNYTEDSGYFEELRDEYVETGKYGQLYVELFHEVDATVDEALDVTRHLRDGRRETGLEELRLLLEEKGKV